MFRNLKNFISNLQAADETKKRGWLFVLTAIAMILIIGSWVIYLNKTIVNLGQSATAEPTDSQSLVQTPKESSWRVFLAGFKTIIGQIKELITAAREISLEINNSDFATSSLEGLNATSTQ